LARLPELVAQVRETIAPFNARAEVWITETGYSTWRQQIAAFTSVAKAPVSRVYWYGLRDLAGDVVVQEGPHFDERHYHFGVDSADGRPKLLGRLLRDGGIEAVRLVAELAAPAISDTRPMLITGGAGFIGANLAHRLAGESNHVLLYDALARPGVEQNLTWLRNQFPDRVSFMLGDTRDRASVAQAVADASAVFHLAGQVAVTTSLEQPEDDLHTNILGTFNLLEAVRRRNEAVPIVFASTNKVYGDLAQVELELAHDGWRPCDETLRRYGLSEDLPLSFASPYGCSKGAADQYVLDYARSFGVPTCVLRMSCIYGPRQLGTEDQGWVAHFMLRAVQGMPVTLFGDGNQVRDILYVTDAVAAYMAAWRCIGRASGRAFNLGGGPENAVSLMQLLTHIQSLLGHSIDVRFDDWRQHDQRYFVSDNRRVRQVLRLPPAAPWREGTAFLMNEIAKRDGTTFVGDEQWPASTMVTA
jgi:CDP-paratose 2-epimerase